MAKLVPSLFVGLLVATIALADPMRDLDTSEARRSYALANNYQSDSSAGNSRERDDGYGSSQNYGRDSQEQPEPYGPSAPKTKKTVILAIPVKLALQQPGQDRDRAYTQESSDQRQSYQSSSSQESNSRPYDSQPSRQYDAPASSNNNGNYGSNNGPSSDKAPARDNYQSPQNNGNNYNAQPQTPSYGNTNSGNYGGQQSYGGQGQQSYGNGNSEEQSYGNSGNYGQDQGQSAYTGGAQSYENARPQGNNNYNANSSPSQGSYSSLGASLGNAGLNAANYQLSSENAGSYDPSGSYPELKNAGYGASGSGAAGAGSAGKRPSYGNANDAEIQAALAGSSAGYGASGLSGLSGLNGKGLSGLNGGYGSGLGEGSYGGGDLSELEALAGLQAGSYGANLGNKLAASGLSYDTEAAALAGAYQGGDDLSAYGAQAQAAAMAQLGGAGAGYGQAGAGAYGAAEMNALRQAQAQYGGGMGAPGAYGQQAALAQAQAAYGRGPSPAAYGQGAAYGAQASALYGRPAGRPGYGAQGSPYAASSYYKSYAPSPYGSYGAASSASKVYLPPATSYGSPSPGSYRYSASGLTGGLGLGKLGSGSSFKSPFKFGNIEFGRSGSFFPSIKIKSPIRI